MRIKRFICMLLALIIVFPQINIFASAEDITAPVLNGYSADLYTKNYNPEGENTPVSNNAKFSVENELYYVIHTGAINPQEEQSPSISVIKEKEYKIELPSPLEVYESIEGTIQYKGEVDASAYKGEIVTISCNIGTFRMTKGEDCAYVTFNMSNVNISGDKGELQEGDINLSWVANAHISIKCNINKDKADIIDQDNNGSIDITMPDRNLTIQVKEITPEPPTAPTLTKTVTKAMDSTGLASWEIVYNAPNQAYIDGGIDIPKKLVDTLPTGLNIIEDSVNVQVALKEQDQTRDDNSKIQTTDIGFTYDISDDVKTVTITYNTQLADEEFYKVWQGENNEYINKVAAFTAENEEIEFLTKEATVSTQNIAALISKQAHDITYHKATETIPDFYTIDWTVYVNTSGKALTSLTLVDTYADGLFVSPHMLDNDDNFAKFGLQIEYTKSLPDGTNPIIHMSYKDVELEETGQVVNGHKKYKINIKLDDYINGTDGAQKIDTTKPFKLTYSMQVDDKFLNGIDPNITADDFKNTVYGIFKTEELNSPVKSTSASNKPSYTIDALISLKGTGYDHTTRKMGWSVIINPPKKIGSQTNLTRVVFQDDASNKAGQTGSEYQSFGWTDEMLEEQRQDIENQIRTQFEQKGLDNADVKVSFEPVGDKQYLNVVMTGTGQAQIDFKYYTYSMDARYWGGNYSSTYQYQNTVYLLAGENGTSINGTPIMDKFSAYATNSMSGIALAKSSTSYDVNSKLLTWTIDLNQRCAPLNQTRIVENLSPELTLYSCKVDGQEIPICEQKPDTGDYVLYENGQPVIYLENVHERHNIQVITKVDINSDTFKNKKSVDLSNTAVLQIFSEVDNNTWIETVRRSENSTIKNDILNKTQTRENNKSTKVDYKVKVNPLGLELLSDDQLHLYLEDTFDDGLSLDEDSIKLYNAKVNISKSGSTYTPNLTTDGDAIEKPNIIFDYAVNKLKVELPQTDKPYILTYSAYITRKNVTLNNNVKIVGSSVPSNSNQSEANQKVEFEYYSGATLIPPANLFYSVVVKKTDKSDNGLAGATIGLYSAQDESKLLGVGVSDENGNCIISVKTRLVNEYETLYVKEMIPPSGYIPNENWFEFDKELGGKSSESSPIRTIENEKMTKETSGALRVYRYDKNTFEPLAGAHLELYTDKVSGSTVFYDISDKELVAEGETNLRGEIYFYGLNPSKAYYLVEQKAPEGYPKDSDYQVIKEVEKITTVTSATKPEDIEQIPLKSGLKTITLTVIKQDSENQKPLKGAEFGLYRDAACENQFGQTVITDANGEAKFPDVDATKAYWLKEIQAPEGYILNNDIIPVDFTKTQDYKIIVEDEKDPDNPPPQVDPDPPAGGEGSSDSGGSSGGGGGSSDSGGSSAGGVAEKPNEPEKDYILEYECNGGTFYGDETYSPNELVRLGKIPYRTGYIFTGWYKDKELTELITDVTMNDNKTVYAGWQKYTPPEILNTDDHFAYIIGYPDGEVKPTGNITRAEVATIFFRLLEPSVREQNLTNKGSFNDVISGMWHNIAISTAEDLGIVKGYEDGSFQPDKPITRAELAAIATRFDKTNVTLYENFSDISGHWAADSIKKAAALGWVKGYPDGTFKPDEPITRAEAMTLINNVLLRLPEKNSDLLDDMIVWPDNTSDMWYYLAMQEATNSHDYNIKSDGIFEAWTKINPVEQWIKYQEK